MEKHKEGKEVNKEMSHEELVRGIQADHRRTQVVVQKKFGSNAEPIIIDNSN